LIQFASKAYGPSSLHDLAQQFKMIGDPARVSLLGLLAETELNVGATADALGMSPGFVSRHLTLLREAGFVKARRDGNHAIYSLTDVGRGFCSAVEKLLS
jgi:DNA-binding transcriptional ArsR family regulator